MTFVLIRQVGFQLSNFKTFEHRFSTSNLSNLVFLYLPVKRG